MLNVCLGGIVTGLLFYGLAMAVGVSAQARTITAKGSDTLVLLARNWADTYMMAHPGVRIEVIGGGSGVGFAALQNRSTDLAHASRRIRPGEVEGCVRAFGRRPTEYRVCLDGLLVYVNQRNPIRSLTLAQLEQVFTGRIRNWSQLGGEDGEIVLYGRESSSGTYEYFKESVLRGKDFAARVRTLQGTAAVLRALAQDPLAIGFTGTAKVDGVAPLALRADADAPSVEPSEATVAGGAYPLGRPLYIYVNPALDRGELADYLRWIRGPEGQAVARANGFYPLPEEPRP